MSQYDENSMLLSHKLTLRKLMVWSVVKLTPYSIASLHPSLLVKPSFINQDEALSSYTTNLVMIATSRVMAEVIQTGSKMDKINLHAAKAKLLPPIL